MVEDPYESATVQILNARGQTISNDPYFKDPAIDVSQLGNGIYILKYSDLKNVSITKFLIQH